MQICNGRAHFYQYDLNQKITSDNFKAGDKIHFYNINQRYALPVLAYEENGRVVADVPNILLTTAYPLIVYRYITEEDASFTKEEYTFQVKARPKPDSYIYKETKLYDLEGAVEVILTKMGITDSYRKISKTVDELPEIGEDKYLYIVPALDNEGRPDNDINDEYIWVNNSWEKLGSAECEHAIDIIQSGSGEGSIIIDKSGTGQATKKNTLSQGLGNNALGDYSHAEGSGNTSIGTAAHSEGYVTKADADYSHSEGQKTHAIQKYAHSEGRETEAAGWSSHSEGVGTKSKGNHSHSEGGATVSTGIASHSEGNATESVGNYSHAEGRAVASIGESSHIEGGGYFTPLSGYNNYAEEAGLSVIENINEPSAVQWEKAWRVPSNKSGKAPEWRFAIAYGKQSHAEGENTLALGSFTHTEGHMNIAKGIAAHAEGIYNEADGKQSHAEGSHTTTQGTASHSEGHRTVSSGRFSHAEGIVTNAGATTIGVIDSDALYVGGTVVSNDPKVGIEIKLSGNFYSTVGNSIVVRDGNTGQQFIAQVTKYDKNNKTITVHNEHTGMPINRSVRIFTLYTGVPSADFNKIISCTEDKLCSTLVLDKVFIGNEASELLIKVGSYYYISHVLSADWSDSAKTTIVIDRLISDLVSDFSSIELHISVDETPGAHAEGYATWAKGKSSHSEGVNTQSSGIGSHSEGTKTIALDEYCHAEGSGTKATGHWTHTEGSGTFSSGYASHAEGVNTKAIASPSHSEGTGTVADEQNLTAIGQYNTLKATRDKNALFVVGNGTNDSNRSDAFRVFKDGTIEGQNFKIDKDGTITTKEWAKEKWILLGDSLTASAEINAEVTPKYTVHDTLNESGEPDFEGTIYGEVWGLTVHSRLPIVAGSIKGSYFGASDQGDSDYTDDGFGNLINSSGDKIGTVNYTTGYFSVSSVTGGILSMTLSSYTSKATLTNKRYFELVSKKTGIAIENRAVSGTGYMRQSDESSSNTSGGSANAFWNTASNIPYDKSSSPIVTIFGSGNDLLHYSNLGDVTDTTTNTICGCINKTLDNIYNRLPLSRVCVVTPTPWKGSTPDKTSGQMAVYVDKLIEICHLRGIPCLDLFHNSALRPDNDTFRDLAYAEDVGCHLNEIGHKLIAPKFKQMLETLIL